MALSEEERKELLEKRKKLREKRRSSPQRTANAATVLPPPNPPTLEQSFREFLTGDTGSALVNAAQGAEIGAPIGAMLGSPFGPIGAGVGTGVGALLGGLGGAAFLSRDNTPEDLGALGLDLLTPGPSGAGTLGRFLAGATGRGLAAGAVGGAIGGESQALGQGLGTFLGQGLGRRLQKGFQPEAIRTPRRSSDIGQEVPEEIAQLSRLQPDEVIQELRQRGLDVPAGVFNEAGRPAEQIRFNRLFAQSGGPATQDIIRQRGIDFDETLQGFIRQNFGDEVGVEAIAEIPRAISQLRPKFLSNGGMTLQLAGREVANLTPQEANALSGLFERSKVSKGKNISKPAEGLVDSIIQFRGGSNAGLTKINAVRKVLKGIDSKGNSTLDQRFKESAFQSIINFSQTDAGGFAGREALTSGQAVSKVINNMSPKKLVSLFDEEGAEAAKLISKAFQSIDPAQTFASATGDFTSIRFLLQKLTFQSASAAAADSVAVGMNQAVKGGLAGTVIAMTIPKFAAKAISNPDLAKQLVKVAREGNPTAVRNFVRTLVADAFDSGEVSFTESGQMILGGQEDSSAFPQPTTPTIEGFLGL